MNILITGGTGFVGANLVHYLLVKKMLSEDFQLFYEMLDNNHVFAYFR